MNYLSTIKELCHRKGITIFKLESMSGISNGTISRWSNVTPSADTLYKVSKALEVPIAWLYEGIPEDIDDQPIPVTQQSPILTEDEQLLFKCYNTSDYMGKARIIQTCLNEYDRVSKK